MIEQEPQTVLDLYVWLSEYRQKYLAQLSESDPETVVEVATKFDEALTELLKTLFQEAINAQNTEHILPLSRLLVWWRNHLVRESVTYDEYREVLNIPLTELGLKWNTFTTILANYPVDVDSNDHIDRETRELIEEWLNCESFYPEGLGFREPVILFSDLRKVFDLSSALSYYFLKKLQVDFKIEVEHLPPSKRQNRHQNGMFVPDARVALYESRGEIS